MIVVGIVMLSCRFSLDTDALEDDGYENSKVILVHQSRAQFVNYLQELMVYATEKKAGVLIAFTFVAIAVVVSIQAGLHLGHEEGPDNGVWLIAFSGVSCLIFMVLGWLKHRISQKLNRL